MWQGRTFYASIPPIIGVQDSAEHERRRRPWNRAFSRDGLKEYQLAIAKRCILFVDILIRERMGDFVHWAQLFA